MMMRDAGGVLDKRRDDIGEVGFGAERNRRLGETETARAHAHLGSRFLAGEIDDAGTVAGKRCGGLQQKRRLADAGIAADKHGGGGDEAAAEDTIELRHAGRQARGVIDRGGEGLKRREPAFAALDGDEGGRARTGSASPR